MGATSDQVVDEARASFDAGDYERAHRAAVAALAERPGDPALLRLAGRAGAELDREDAVALLEQAVASDPENGEAWRDLGEALVSAGRIPGAGDALRRAAELRPGDADILVHLGHVELAAGRGDDAAEHFQQAVEHAPDNVAALRALVDARRRQARLDDALAVAQAASDARPTDVLGALEVADLALELGRLDGAERAFRRMRAADDDPEHEVYAYHGLIEVEVHRGQWRRALDLAVDATRVDRLGRTTDVLSFVVAQVFGAAERPTVARHEVEGALAQSRTEHRRLHLEALGAEEETP
jgi:tetratricopeptide (TPR) repeat protein